MRRRLAFLVALLAYGTFLFAQQLTPLNFGAVKITAAWAAGVPLPAPNQIGQGELPPGTVGEFDSHSSPMITIDTKQLAAHLGTNDQAALMGGAVVVLAHELMHLAGYGEEDESETPWYEQTASQSNCEHVAMYMADLSVACQMATLAYAANQSAALSAMCKLVAESQAELATGHLAPMLAACQAAQGATPPTYSPPIPRLELPAEMPAPCEACAQ
jgi:hypothetical protein